MIKNNLKKILLILPILVLALSLRLWKLDLLPPYWEEVALGYDAYSIAQTWHDHHGNFLPLVAFESFGDWKPSGYFYAAAAVIKILGLSVWSVRLPSVIAGLMIVLGVGALATSLKKSLSLPNYFPWLSMLVTALNPWAILFSRAAWEVNLATALLLWGVVLFWQFLEKNQRINFQSKLIYLISSVTLLVMSTYTYHATRIIAPLLGLGLVVLWLAQNINLNNFKLTLVKFTKQNYQLILILLVWSLILMTPFLISLKESKVTQRFAETSIFSSLEPVLFSNQLAELQPGLIGKITAHRYLWWSREVTHNYVKHFDLEFLFISGDGNPRHSTQYTGLFYHFDLVFVLLGLYLLFKKLKDQKLQFLVWWLVVGIIPASLTLATPHALRILPTLPVWMILITLGLTQLFTQLKKINLNLTRATSLLIAVIYLVEFLMFWQFYTSVYPIEYAQEWQTGYQQVMTFLGKDEFKNQPIYVTRNQGRPAMYYWFFNQTDPQQVQTATLTAPTDQGEILEFENVKFINGVGEIKTAPSVVATSPQQIQELKTNHADWNFEVLQEIISPQGDIIWQVTRVTN